MARIRKYKQLIALAKTTNGILMVDHPDVLTILDGTLYRLPTQMWCIKTKAGLEVRPVRQGRKIIAYEIPALAWSAQPAVDPATLTPVGAFTPVAETVAESVAETQAAV